MRLRRLLPLVLWLGLATSIGCGGGGASPPEDAGPDASADAGPSTDAGTACRSAADCDDGLFCNGAEACDPPDPDADADGCVSGEAPCDGACDEVFDRCPTACDDPDADRDGHARPECGGDDCDDADPSSFPGNVEVCDAAGHDEDCDPETLGFDFDRDGHVDDRCCNVQTDGSLACGDDCDDLRATVLPGAIDSCNEVDDDCDGTVDENPSLVFYVDADGDGFGLAGDPDDESLDASVRPIRACTTPEGYSLDDGDCNDDAVQAHPGAPELCDPLDVDEDCDGVSDEYGPDAASPAVNPTIFYVDADGDGWGVGDRIALGCSAPAGFVDRPGDCRDDRGDVHPGADFRSTPSCPATYVSGDLARRVSPTYCTDHWECVPESYVCGQLRNQSGFDPVWDLDCSGIVQVPRTFGCADADGTCVPFMEFSLGSPADCGRGAYFATYECQRAMAGYCEPVGVGGKIGLPCR